MGFSILLICGRFVLRSQEGTKTTKSSKLRKRDYEPKHASLMISYMILVPLPLSHLLQTSSGALKHTNMQHDPIPESSVAVT